MAVNPYRYRIPGSAYFLGALLCLLLDQALKFWTVQTFSEGEFREFIPGVLSLGLVYNTGAAWGLFAGAALPLAALRVVVGTALLMYLMRRAVRPLTGVAFTLMAGGAISNAVDGWRLGKVVDTLSSHTFSSITRLFGQGNFPIFNLADMCVVSGVVIVVLISFRVGRTSSPASTHRRFP